MAQRQLPALGHLDGVGGAEEAEVRDGAQGCQMLDGLVGRAVLAEADGIVGHDVDDALAHQGGEADGGPCVVGEDEEGAGEGDEAPVQGHAVHDGRHAVLARTVVEVAAAEVAGGDGAALGGLGVVGGGEVARAADEGGECRDQALEDVAGGEAGGFDALLGEQPLLGLGDEVGEVGGQAAVECGLEGCAPGGIGGGEPLLPGGVRRLAGLGEGFPGLLDVGGDGEGRVRPVHCRLGAGHLGVAQHAGMGRGLAGLGGEEAADHRLEAEQGRPVARPCPVEGCGHGLDVVAVDELDPPAVGVEALGGVVAQGQVGRAVDGDVVVVVEDDQAWRGGGGRRGRPPRG